MPGNRYFLLFFLVFSGYTVYLLFFTNLRTRAENIRPKYVTAQEQILKRLANGKRFVS